MKLRTTLWLGGVIILLSLIPLGILLYQNNKLKEQITQYAGQLDISHKALTKSLQRAETKLAKNNKELDIFAEQNGINIKAVQEDLDSLGGRLEAVASTEAKTVTVVHNNYLSDSTTNSKIEIPICKSDGRPIDIYSYTKRIETKELSDSNGMRIANVSFTAAEKRPWNSKTYGITYKILNTIGKGPNNQVILTTELTAENPEAQPGKIFRIKGVSSRVLQAPEPSPNFDWWNPSLYLMGQLALIVHEEIDFSASLSIGFSIWSYSDNWRFFGVSAGYDAFQRTFRASFIPVLYNIGGPLPLLTNLWVYADIGISHLGSVSIGFGLATSI